MTLDNLGSIGEFVGAIAVLASLIYLALQVRQATKWQRHAAFEAMAGRAADWWANISRDPEVARIYLDGCTDLGSLEREDRVRFHALLIQLFVGCEMMVRMSEDRLLDAQIRDTVEGFLRSLLGTPGVRAWWHEQGSEVVSADFRARVDRLAAA